MKFKNIIFALLFSISLAFSQNSWKETFDVWYDLGHTYTGTVAVTQVSGKYYLLATGATEIHIYMPVLKSQGLMRVWGISYRVDAEATSDSLFFSVAKHSGSGGLNGAFADFVPVYYPVDTCIVTTGAGNYAQFDFSPVNANTLANHESVYIDLKIVSRATMTRRFYIKIEWLESN